MIVLAGLLALAVAYFAAAFLTAARRPNGRLYPARRDKLLRHRGPLAVGRLEDVTVRGVAEAGGEPRVLLAATYRYQVAGRDYRLSLPLPAERLGGAAVRSVERARARTRWLPSALTLADGRELRGPQEIAAHYREMALQTLGEVQVLYASRNPELATVRDWAPECAAGSPAR
ncbi:MAG TPA: hypothetical protein VHN99_03610 [Deinococcales bacterium]|nr:hypothetical protein [Deinococcales bacterium]